MQFYNNKYAIIIEKIQANLEGVLWIEKFYW